MIASSARGCASPAKIKGWFGTMRNSAATDRVATAAIASSGFARAGLSRLLEPPPMRCVRGNFFRHNYGQPVFPQRPVDFRLVAPAL